MATRATQHIGTAGLEATYHAASSGGDKVSPGEGMFIHVVNGSGADITVTLVTPQTVDTLEVEDRDVTVTTSESRFIAVPAMYRDPSDGLASIEWSSATDVTFAALKA